MSEEDAFLRKLLEQPNSDLTRLVYADWLDEQQTPDAVAKAEFLRLIAGAELAGLISDRVEELAGQLDPQWLAIVSKLAIENCRESQERQVRVNSFGLEFVFECPKRWEDLTPTEEGNGVRFCGACKRTFHYCHDADDLRTHANLGNCVAVELGVPRRPGDLESEYSEMMTTMGILAHDPEHSAREWPVEQTLRRSWWARLLRRERRRNPE